MAIVFISGIGCSSRTTLPETCSFHSIHGRAPAMAAGLALYPRTSVGMGGHRRPGDTLSIGGNHLIHARCATINVTILLFSNRIYGLTKGRRADPEVGEV